MTDVKNAPEGRLVDRTDARFERALRELGFVSGVGKWHWQYPGPITGYALPGSQSIPIEVPLVLPLAAAPAKQTIPKVIKGGKWAGIDGLRALRAHLLRRQALAHAAKVAKYGKYAKTLGPLLGFQLGWELGDYLWPNGWYDFGVSSGVPDQSVGPDGWTSPYYVYTPCTFNCNTETFGDFRYRATQPNAWVCAPNCSPLGTIGIGSTVLSPAAAQNQALGVQTITVGRVRNNVPTSVRAIGQLAWTGVGEEAAQEDDAWTQVFETSPAPAPLARPRPSEAPEAFPLEWPMEMPWPQPWKEALPKPKTQGEGKHRQTYRGSSEVSRMPLAPFPVVVVTPPVLPPGGSVPPPPDQVITLPPPALPGRPAKPPTYHTAPPAGRRPPDGKTKEKKLSVRSKANKAWIVLNLATEAFDFVDALFKALPDDVQKKTRASIDYGEKGGGKADPYSKARAIWANFDDIDWDKFTNVFINQQLADMAVGMIGMAASHGLKASGAATGSGGIANKPGSQAEKFSDAQIDAQVEAGEISKEEGKALDEADDLPIPQVSYENGQWVVSIG